MVTDASVLATLADGLLIVARANHTRTGQLRATVEELAQSGRPIAGVIMNRVASRDAYYYYGAAGRAYGEDSARDGERLRIADLGNGNGANGNGRDHGDSEPEGVSTLPASSAARSSVTGARVAAVGDDDEA